MSKSLNISAIVAFTLFSNLMIGCGGYEEPTTLEQKDTPSPSVDLTYECEYSHQCDDGDDMTVDMCEYDADSGTQCQNPRVKLFVTDMDGDGFLVELSAAEVCENMESIDPTSCEEGVELAVITAGLSYGDCDDSDSEIGSTSNMNQACGLNGNGQQVRTCTDGDWTDWSDCVDTDVCENGKIDSQACGFNGNGTQSRTCADGQWPEEFTACEDPDVCENGAIDDEVCGLNGAGLQLLNCEEGQWTPVGACVNDDVCEDGDTDEQACGLNGNGTMSRTCEDGQWSEFGACVDPDTCVNEETQSQDCGFNGNGTQMRTCVEGQWTEFDTCVDPDTCLNGTTFTEACGFNGNGTQVNTCVAGQWTDGSCDDPDVCTNGESQEQACGVNSEGVETRTCVEGQWTEFGQCTGDDVCVNGDTEEQACGLNANGTQERTCVEGQWSEFAECVNTDVCENGTFEDEPCGFNGNGTMSRTCEDGQWSEFENCDDPDVCENDATQTVACGLNGNGEMEQTCIEGQWSDGACVDPDNCASDLDCTNFVPEGFEPYTFGDLEFWRMGDESFGCVQLPEDETPMCQACTDVDGDGICGTDSEPECLENADCADGFVCDLLTETCVVEEEENVLVRWCYTDAPEEGWYGNMSYTLADGGWFSAWDLPLDAEGCAEHLVPASTPFVHVEGSVGLVSGDNNGFWFGAGNPPDSIEVNGLEKAVPDYTPDMGYLVWL